jgi:hypothetical protein
VADLATQLPCLAVFAALQTAGLAVTSVRYLLSLRGPLGTNGHLVTGDFMAFFTVAKMIRRGMGRSLYDLAVQRRVQTEIVGKELSYWIPYQNPPALALALAGVGALAYVHAFYVYVAGMVAAMTLTAVLLRPVLPEVLGRRGRWIVTVLLIATFQPVLRTMVGGQNTVLSLMLLAGLFASLQQRRAVRAGLFLGLLTYKPQLCSLATVFLALRGELRTLGTAATVAAAHYIIAAMPCGWSWPAALLRQFHAVRSLEFASKQNVRTHFSVWPVALSVAPAPWATLGAAIASLSVVLCVGASVRRHAAAPSSFALVFGMVVSGTLLISPHLQYYDAGLMVLPALLILTHLLRQDGVVGRGSRVALAVGYVAYPLHALGPTLGVQPLFFGLVAMFVWNAVLLHKHATGRPTLVGAERGGSTDSR